MIIGVWQATLAMKERDQLNEPTVLVAMRQMSTVWEQLFPIEQHRVLRLLIERVQLHDDGLEIVWQQNGWREFGRKLGGHALIEEQREPEDAHNNVEDCEVLS